MVRKSVPSSVADLLSLAIPCVETMCRASTLEVLIGALLSTLSSNNAPIRTLKSPLSLKTSEIDGAAA